MKKSYQRLCLLFIFLALSTASFAQNNLAAGDIAIVSYQSDFDPSNPIAGDNDLAEREDRFSIVVLKPGGLAAGTVIYFTDRGWNAVSNNWHDETYPPNTFGLGHEAVIRWTVPAGGIIQGKEVFFINLYHDEVPVGSEFYEWFAYSDEAGTIPLGTVSNETPIVPPTGPGITDGLNFTFGGDNLLVYQTGPVGGPTGGYNATPIRFITALLANIRANDVPPVGNPTNYATWDPAPQTLNESSIPPGLINGQTCFLMSPGPLPHLVSPVPGTVEPDNGKFTGCGLTNTGTQCTALGMSAIIYNIANWTYNNAVFPLGQSSGQCTYTFATPNTITLSSAAGTDAQTVCVNTAIVNITYNTTGATGATFSGLPAGVTGNWAANVVTISGTPTTAVGSPFNYTVTLTGGCGIVTANGTITVNPDNTAGAPTSTPTLCINTLLTNITHATTGATGIGAPTGLPAGVTANWAANVITISGTPTASGIFNYNIPLTGGCGTVSATGTITVSPNNTISLTSAPGTDNQTVNVLTPITNITYATTGATGATFSGLPSGVTGNWAANVVTISGSPTTAVGSPFNYTVNLTGGCGTVSASGTITVTTCTVSLTSAAGTDAQTVCVNTPIINITYSTVGATGATFSGLPAGVSGNWVADVITISGTPTTTVGSPFSYTITQVGGTCAGTTASGTITVNPTPDVAQPANQVVCNNGATAAVNFTGAVAGTVFNWTNTDPTIGLAASGTGNIASFTATNTTNAPVTATVTVTPSTGGGGGGGLIPELLYYKFDGSGASVPNLASAPPGGTATATLQGGLTQGGSAICNGTIIGTGVSSTTDFLNSGWAPNLGLGQSWSISFKSENIAPSATLFYCFGDINTNSFRCFTNGVAGANNWILRGGGLTDVLLSGGATVAPHTNTFVYDAALNQVRAYLDGVLVATIAQGAVNLTGAGPFKVNGYSANVGSPANGHYDEFKFFNRAITPAEVLSLNGCPALGPTCTGTPRTFNYTVNPTPTVDPVANQSVCNNAATTAVNFTGFVPGTVYNWTNSDPSIGLAASGTGNIPSFTATNPGTAPVTATITVTPSYTNAGVTCTGTPITFNITVNPTGQVNQPANQVVCNNTATAPVNFTTTVPGTIFDWVNNTPSIGLAASGSGDIASFTATNATNAPVVATVIVTPSYSPSVPGTQTFNFTGAMQTFTVPAGVTSVFLQTWGAQGGTGAVGGNSVSGGTGGLGAYAEGNLAVTPGQVLNIFVGGQGAAPAGGFNGGANGGSQNAGGGGGSSDIRAGGSGAANRVITAGGGGGGGRGGCDEGVASTGGIGGNGGSGGGGVGQNGNSSPTSGGVAGGGFGGNAVSVQGAFGAAGIGCAGFLGQPGNTTLTEVGGNGGGGQSCCCGSQPTIVGGGGGGGGQLGGGGGGGGSAGTTGCSGNSKGAGGGGGGGSSYIGGVTAGATNSGIWLGNGQVTVSWGAAGGVSCPGTPRTFTYTVNPTPTVDPVASIAVCNGATVAAINFTGFVPGTVYNWTNTNTAIGLGASATGNIASFTATNPGSAPISGTITVTPSYTNAGVTCTGTPITFTITVNPTGQVDQPADQVICNGAPTAPVNFTTTVPGTIFNWTNSTPAIGLAASGTGNIASFIGTNATNAPLVGTIVVTPVYVPVASASQTFNFTGGIQTFTVPAGVTSVFLQSWGAQGGSGATGGNATAGGSGGLGGYAEGNLAVVPGQVLNIFVGGQGATPTGGFNGGASGGSTNAGGGGGASDIRAGGTAEANRVITAGGGGGGGRAGCETAAAGVGGTGGSGGSGVGANGGDSPTSGGVAGGGRGGNFGAVQGAFGAAGIGCGGFLGSPGGTAATGTGASGGAGQSCCCFSFGSIPGGGGGGGGQLGGGGGGGGSAGTAGCSGNDKGAGGGGGGGSSYIGGVTAGATNNGIWLGNGQVTVSWAVAAGAPCPGPTKTFTITVNPVAQVNQPANQVVCNNTSFAPTNFTTPTTGGTITYAWTNNNTSVGLGASGTGNISAFVGTNATNAPNVATVTVTPSITTPAPAVPVTTTFSFTGAMQTWTVPAGVTSITINSYGAQGAQGANGNSNSGPTSGGFGGRGSRATGTLAVTPGQVLNIFVGGVASGAIGGFNGGGAGANNAGGGGGASDVRFPGAAAADRLIVAAGGGGGGRGGCESGTAIVGGPGGGGDINGTNGTNAPTSGGVAGGGFGAIGSNFGAAGIGCAGFLGAPGTSGVASGVGGNGGAGQSCCCFSFGSIPGGGGGGGGFVGGGGAGGGSAGTTGCSGNDKGAGGGGAGGSSYTGGVTAGSVTTAVQNGNGQVVITYNGAGTITCVGTPKTFTYTVNPTATVDPVANQVVCNGAATTAVNFTSPTTGGTIVYNWTNSAPSIGLAASGSGNIASFTAVNVTAVPVVATITVTPAYTNGSVTCNGTPMIFTITVNPPPVVNPVASPVVCNGAPTANINFTTPVSGGTIVFNWTNSDPSIGLPAAGTGDILSFNAINTGNAPVVATITVTMTYTNGGVTCISLPVTFTITVNPTPQVNQPADQVLCANTPTAPVNFTGTVAGTVYNWTNNTPSIGLAASGTGNIASFTALNPGLVPIVATIVVTPSYTNGGVTCTGPFKTFTITVNPVPTVAPVSNKAYCTGVLTAIIPFNGTAGNVPGTVYNWTNSTPAIGLPASGTGDILPFVTANPTFGPLVATIVVTPVSPSGCVGTPVTFTITVNPTPIVNPVTSQVLCNGSPTAVINFSSPNTGPTGALTFQWTNSAPSIGLAANGSGNIPSFIAVNTGLSPVIALITVTPVYTNAGITCTGTSQTFTITVNPTPTVNPVANQVHCVGSATAAVNFTGSVFGTIYNWTNNNTSIGLAAAGAGNIASFTTINAGTTPQVATITVTPNYTNGGVTCPGAPITFTITVNPIPTANPVANQTVCAGATVTQAFSGPVAGTVFNWTNSNTAIGLGASGTGNLNFVSTNASNAPVTGTITVTPTYTNGGGTCTGTPITFTITVNPIPTVNAVTPQVVCNGANTAAVNFTGPVSGTVYSWVNSNTSIGLAAAGTGNIASFVATNVTAVVQTATITVTPTYTNGGTTCTGPTITFTYTVNPTPAVNTVANQTVCNGAATTAVTFTGPVAGTVYTWTNNNTSIGLGSSGTGNIASFTAINAGSTPVTATITVTPRFTNGGITCTGATSSFTITVNPTAVVNQPANQLLCNGATTSAVVFSGLPPGSTYNWTNNNTAIGLAASGTGNIPGFTATNTTNAPITGTITVTPTSTGCGGLPVSFTITVNPTPSVNAIANQTVCDGASTAAVTITGPVVGTVYTWSNSNPSIGLGPNGTGNIPAFIANNPSNTPRVATITVTPNYTNGGITCTGTPVSFTITVNPLPNIIFLNVPPRVCLTDTIVTLTATPGGTWSGPGISGNTFSAAAAGIGVHRVTYTATNGFGCTTTRFANIVVNDCIERHNVFQQAIRIWPNPNNGRFSVQFNSDKYKEFKVKIVNARGQEMAYYEFKNLVYAQILPFDLSRLASGQYFLYVYNTQESGVFPIVIAR